MATRRQIKKAAKAAERKAAAKELQAAAVETTVEAAVEAEVKIEEKVAEKKAEVKKTAAAKTKKTTAKKDFKTNIILQYGEKEVTTKEMIAAVKKEWTKAKHKISEIKSMELYVKPEENAVYYVINGDTSGKVCM